MIRLSTTLPWAFFHIGRIVRCKKGPYLKYNSVTKARHLEFEALKIKEHIEINKPGLEASEAKSTKIRLFWLNQYRFVARTLWATEKALTIPTCYIDLFANVSIEACVASTTLVCKSFLF